MVINSHTYAGDLLRRIGVEVIGGISEYSKVDLDDFKSRVDVVLAPSEPYKFTKRQLPELTQVAPKVEFVDGKDLFLVGSTHFKCTYSPESSAHTPSRRAGGGDWELAASSKPTEASSKLRLAPPHIQLAIEVLSCDI